MSEENGQQEPSMEEILASIRKIISEDEEQEKAVEGVTNSNASELESPSNSEPVLDPDSEPVSEPESVSESSAELEEEEDLELIEQEEDLGIEATDGDDEELELKPEWAETIVSDPTTQAGVDSFGQLAGIIAGRMQLGQGRTVEELVQELLKPLLREWLDKNLPELVDELVKKEIERMVEKANR
tara:strand:- start:187 stop:741 length:555 start_codon:yes stop_codon:yes gene_type:complete